MEKLVTVLLLSVCLGLAMVVAASMRVPSDDIAEKGLKRVAQEIWYVRGNVVELTCLKEIPFL